MDVREQGLSILWLRVLHRNSPHQRERLYDYLEKFIAQVKLSERSLNGTERTT